jgi:choline-sulfatase
MNILMIMADQMAAGVLGAAGHPAVMTPHLDRLAAAGARFDNCYCNSPLCVPSRASMLTGRLPSAIQSFDNGSELPASVPTFVHALRRGGYRTALSGKMHFIGPDQLHGFEDRLTPDIYPAAVDWTPDWGRGLYANPGTSARRLTRSGPRANNDQIVYDEKVTAAGIDYLAKLAGDRDPFFLCVSFTHPHCPFEAPPEQWAQYEGRPIDPPAAGPDPVVHEFNHWINVHHELDVYQPDEETILRSRRAYYAMVSYVDAKVGQLLDALQRTGRADGTIVLFTSDHGEMLGEHGMWFKRTFFDGAAKAPLIIRHPAGRRGLCESHVVSLVDLFPTILDLADLSAAKNEPAFANHVGRTFFPALFSQPVEWKDEAICEYCGEGTIQPMRLVRWGDFKYVFVPGCAPLLFNLRTDPLEQHNVAGQTDLAAIQAELHRSLLRDWDCEKLSARIRQSQAERIALSEALRRGRQFPWDWRGAE